MDISILIFSAASFAMGVFFGLIIELAVDNDTLHKMEIENEKLINTIIKLERDNYLLKKMIKGENSEVNIEKNDDLFEPF